MTTAATNCRLFLGEVALRLGAATWQVQRLYERGLLPPPERVGRYRVVSEDQLPTVAAALRAAGYLPDETPEISKTECPAHE
jgi:hypothetical protein